MPSCGWLPEPAALADQFDRFPRGGREPDWLGPSPPNAPDATLHLSLQHGLNDMIPERDEAPPPAQTIAIPLPSTPAAAPPTMNFGADISRLSDRNRRYVRKFAFKLVTDAIDLAARLSPAPPRRHPRRNGCRR